MKNYLGGNQFLTPIQVIERAGVSEGERVADLGCGSGGYFVIPFARKVGPTGHVYAVDVQPPVLETVAAAAQSEHLGNITTIRSNLEKVGSTPIENTSLDAAFLINVLFQNPDRRSIISEACRMIKKGGRLVIVDWLDRDTAVGPMKNIRVDRERIERIANEFGCETQSNDEIGPHHFMLVMRKNI